MADLIEYAQLAAHVYAVANRENKVAVPLGWTELDWLPDQTGLADGFSAGAYMRGNEIVIAYTGTNEFADGVNWGIGLGISLPQIYRAVEYYQAFRTVYPTASFTFTGHSLGGGLASLMAVFFDKQATTFDEAPFQLAALSPQVLTGVTSFMTANGMKDSAFDSYVASLGLAALSREYNITHYAIEGEVLGYPRTSITTLVGADHVVQKKDCTAGVVQLHSMTLLTAALASPNFHEVMQQLPSLVGQMMDASLFFADANNETKRDLLRHLLRHQFGADGIAADGMLDRFGADFYALARFGAAAADTPLVRAIIGVGLQHYYQQSTTQEHFFQQLSGGVQFDLTKPLGDNGADLQNILGYENLLVAARPLAAWETPNGYPQPYEALNDYTADKVRWNVALGSGGLNGTATGNTVDLVLGGAQADNFAAGGGADLLIGGGGTDTLQGDAGKDILYGGTESDNLGGGADDDKLYGGAGTDTLQGDKGDDLLVGGDGADMLHGGENADELYGDAKEKEDQESPTAGADHLHGDAGDDKLYGGAGKDVLFGDADADTLVGNGGTDVLLGGKGSDTYIYAGKSGAQDYIVDERENDAVLKGKIEYDKIVLTGGSRPTGQLQYRWRSDDGYMDSVPGLHQAMQRDVEKLGVTSGNPCGTGGTVNDGRWRRAA
jgi:hypothetical protein